MSWFNRKKKLFLIKLMAVLGYGGMAAYCIGGCDSKPAQNESPKSVETNNSKPPQNEPPKSVETNNSKPTQNEPPKSVETNNSKPTQNELPKSVETNNSKPTQNESPKSVETNINTKKTVVPSESEYLEFNIEYFPADAKVTAGNFGRGRDEIICEHSPCHYRIERIEASQMETLWLRISAPGYYPDVLILNNENDIHLKPTIHIELHERKPDTDMKPKKPEFKYLAAY